MEDSERRSREDFSERTEGLFWDVNDAMDEAQNPSNQTGDVLQDEQYVTLIVCDLTYLGGID